MSWCYKYQMHYVSKLFMVLNLDPPDKLNRISFIVSYFCFVVIIKKVCAINTKQMYLGNRREYISDDKGRRDRRKSYQYWNENFFFFKSVN